MLERKSYGVSYYSAETSQEIDDNTDLDEEANTNEISQYYKVALEEVCPKILNIGVSNLYIIDVSPHSTTIGILREMGSLGNQGRDNSDGSFDNGKYLSFDKARGVRKKLPRFHQDIGESFVWVLPKQVLGSLKKITLRGSVKIKDDFLDV